MTHNSVRFAPKLEYFRVQRCLVFTLNEMFWNVKGKVLKVKVDWRNLSMSRGVYDLTLRVKGEDRFLEVLK